MTRTIEQLLAEAEIKDLHIRTCRANDRLDAELMRSCFHPDAVIELHRPFDVEGFIAFGRQALQAFVLTWHNTGNQLVEVDGDVAWTEHYTISAHRMAATADAPERDLIAHNRYIDRVERRAGVWRFARRRIVMDYARTDPVLPSPPGFDSRAGRRDRTDPSYEGRLRG